MTKFFKMPKGNLILTGILTLVFTCGAILWENALVPLLTYLWPDVGRWIDSQPIPTGIMALLSIALAWTIGKLRQQKLDVLSSPQLSLQCGSSIKDCHVETTLSWDATIPNAQYYSGSTSPPPGSTIHRQSIDVKYFRVCVNAVGPKSVERCVGQISSIEQDGHKLNAEPLRVPFAPGNGNDAFSKLINHGMTEHLDIFYITKVRNKVNLPISHRGYPASVNIAEIFRNPGIFKIVVSVSGIDIRECTITLTFNWTGNWKTAELEQDISY